MQPLNPKIYHILHIDRLKSVIDNGGLWSDNEVVNQKLSGTVIGMDKIKQRRMTELRLRTYPDIFVGQCVPFYFCPRSVMLFLIYKGNSPEITYKDGQESIIHLEADLKSTISWAIENNKRWVFTYSSAASHYFEDSNDLNDLTKLNWEAIQQTQWQEVKEKKQAEFLCEQFFDFHLVERIGVKNKAILTQVQEMLANNSVPNIEIKPEWYY